MTSTKTNRPFTTDKTQTVWGYAPLQFNKLIWTYICNLKKRGYNATTYKTKPPKIRSLVVSFYSGSGFSGQVFIFSQCLSHLLSALLAVVWSFTSWQNSHIFSHGLCVIGILSGRFMPYHGCFKQKSFFNDVAFFGVAPPFESNIFFSLLMFCLFKRHH